MLYEVITIVAFSAREALAETQRQYSEWKSDSVTPEASPVAEAPDAGAVPATVQAEAARRITSYNVCYTKLLRGGALGSLLSGYLWTGMGAQAMYLMAAGASLAALVVVFCGIRTGQGI